MSTTVSDAKGDIKERVSKQQSASDASRSPVASTRSRLLQAVIEIAGREGERMVTYRSVAARAGVSHGLARHYFGSREAMLDEAFRTAAQLDISDSKIATDSIDKFADGLVNMLDRDSARQLMQFDLVLAAIRGRDSAGTAEALYGRFYEQTAATVAQAGIPDPDDEWAILLFAAIDGISLQHFVFGDVSRTEALLDKLRSLLRTLSADSSPAPHQE